MGWPRTCSGTCIILSSSAVVNVAVWHDGLLGPHLGVEELGDAEVQQLWLAGGHKDIRGLEVAVNHEILVRCSHRLADL